jgi:hypothetical protein
LQAILTLPLRSGVLAVFTRDITALGGVTARFTTLPGFVLPVFLITGRLVRSPAAFPLSRIPLTEVPLSVTTLGVTTLVWLGCSLIRIAWLLILFPLPIT